MARFNIELSVTGAANTNKALSSVNREATSLEKGYQRLQSTIRDLSRQQGNLQTSMQRLNSAFKSGSISEAQFTKQSDKLSLELSDVAGKIQQAQSRLTSYNATMKQAENASRSFGTANKQLQGYANDFTSGIRSSNAVAIEFSRIIQDAPYGIQGVANNLQQLTQNYAYYTRSVREAAAAEGRTVSTGALVRGALGSLLSPINLLTLGISAVTAGWVAYEKWSQRAAKATREAEQAHRDFIETLKGVNRALAEGEQSAQKDVQQLRLLYEATQNTTLSLEDRRKAAQEIINQYPAQFKGLTTEAILVGEAASAYRQLSADLLATAQAQASLDRITQNANKILSARLEILQLQNDANKISAEIAKEQSVVRTDEAALQQSGTVSALEARREKILERINELGAQAGEYNEENIQLQNEYNNQLQKGADLSGSINTNTEKTASSKSKEINIWDRIIKLQQQFQLDGLNGYQKDIQAIKNKYDEELKLAQRNNDAIRELERLRLAEIGRVLGNTQFTQGLRAPSSPVLNTGAGEVVQRNIQQPYVAPKVDWSEWTTGLKRATNRFVRDFTTGLDGIAQDANYKIGGILAGLGTNIVNAMLPVFQNFFSNKLEGILGDAFDNLSKRFGESSAKSIQAIAAGAGVLGGVVSQVSRPTSAVGQGIGGALSGAAAGLSFGPIGAVVGGVIGAISGIVGANRRRKLEEEQLAEQKKQTALMERAQRLAFTSSIVGQQTSQGIISGVDRNEFGDVTFRIQGRDLVAVAQKESTAQGRGL